jgi:hypothetical protein
MIQIKKDMLVVLHDALKTCFSISTIGVITGSDKKVKPMEIGIKTKA